jgi:hypothetical protein
VATILVAAPAKSSRFPVDTTVTGPYIRQARRKVTGAQGQLNGSPRRKWTARIPTFKSENRQALMPL